MQIALRLPPGRTMESLAADIAQAVLSAIRDDIKVEFNPGHTVTLQHEVMDQVRGWLGVEHLPADFKGLVFKHLEEFERFQADLAALLLCRLGDLIGKEHAVFLVAREIPLAITRALEPFMESGPPPGETVHGLLRSTVDQWQDATSA